MEKYYDYNKERPWISAILDMQMEQNKSIILSLKSFEMRIKRLEDITDNLNDAFYGENKDNIEDLDSPTGLGINTATDKPGRFKI